jgi:hypothetical protein
MRFFALLLAMFLALSCSAQTADNAPEQQAATTQEISPVTTQSWSEVVISVLDLEQTARFFTEIGKYEERARGPLDAAELAYWGLPEGASGESLVLAAPGSTHGLVRLVRFDNAGRQEPMRPGARAWDKGCYFSLMIRMKDIHDIYDEAIRLGWWTETPISDLEFGTSKLKVVIFKGPGGLQVQGYERLSPPLPAAIPPFERMTQPFNIMQMSKDREQSRKLMQDVLGFDTFFYGPPYTDEQPTFMPLGIPYNLTTSVRYRTGIFYPVAGEFGRMEFIDIMDLQGHDFSDRCKAPNLGLLTIRYPVENAAEAMSAITERGWTVDRALTQASTASIGDIQVFGITSPDGAMIDFYER